MLTVFGSTALDTIRTPTKTLKDVLGGAATFAGVSASFFVDTGLIAVVGKDFPKKHHDLLAKHMDLKGLHIAKGKTFRYDGKYDETLSTRETLKTELNVLANFKPTVPEEYKKSRFVYLANNDPEQNASLIKEFDNVKFSMCDTIEFWIATKRNAVIKMIKSVDAIVINDEEAKLLTKEHNLIKCAKKMMSWGAKYVIIKKGEHGSLMFFDDVIFPSAGFSLEDVVDPTGAGDSFAGAMIGYLASKNSTTLSAIKKGVVYGNVLGSFAVERYGLDGLTKVKKSDIEKRVKIYEKMIRF
ncbi:sugar kinase [Nitrosopumilus sp. b1]|uniref:PfkB family carbohydrate kinase n=1 Tax=Nitrosopumilus sp. b1 TaxID=2109907 RepID=UPI000E2D6FF0|nr:PfkB family carbohydrate kinase [Nitrosopumilus sp. b1]RDJ31954.1 MAG: sugar kinase [Thermoproteota archaeon]KAF6243042.1 sugar kinase [Nitrosopumilus sp. b1]RDJ34480.1 MAG: sugar kinase [Thermoproteota archaeon]RDJ34818.1 MAG: sugar kinase [Thermoproteota archaeon]RDJ38578.1 MAG: sugar kinase [Thermoproteota archaeon]